jgi:4-phospho-D-threonate 3-dehydrogenase / 4-phospho-D-erythronate 3-dehydrogenase
MEKPVIGITMGDAAGIGPEIIVKAMKERLIYETCRPVIIGDVKMLDKIITMLKLDLKTNSIQIIDQAGFKPGVIDCVDLDLLPYEIQFGKLSGLTGDAAFRYLEKAILLARTGKIDGICTAPLNKEALHMGGHNYPGHTEILAEFTGTQEYAMMLASPKLKVILVTIHLGLIDAVKAITPERVYKSISLANNALQQMGYIRPRIAVCGINPHAGEGGLFGNREEEEKIVPAIEQALKEGMNASGPHPADTLFYRAVRGDFEVVVAMYHDQGLIPIKTLGIEAGVNLTIGLPFVRTSVDHGTAFDIAGKGIANAENMKVAILLAADFAKNKIRSIKEG